MQSLAKKFGHSYSPSHKFRELTPMFLIRFNPDDEPSTYSIASALGIARKCKGAIKNGMRQDLEVIFVNLNGKLESELKTLREKHYLVTIGDWAKSLETIFAAGSDHCPKCGSKSFTYPVAYCECCGANPGVIFEQAGGLFVDS